jgi:pyocin large subunit-like protein
MNKKTAVNGASESPDGSATMPDHRVEATGANLQTIVGDAVTKADVGDARSVPTSISAKRRSEQFRERLDAWTRLNPVLDHEIDDSRESIYERRGE